EEVRERSCGVGIAERAERCDLGHAAILRRDSWALRALRIGSSPAEAALLQVVLVPARVTRRPGSPGGVLTCDVPAYGPLPSRRPRRSSSRRARPQEHRLAAGPARPTRENHSS